MLNSTAQAISTVGIWLAVAVTLAFGVFSSNWNGIGVLALVVIVLVICGAAAWATGAIWGKVGHTPLPPRANLCKKCGYDRTGLAAGSVCPECGSAGAAPFSS